MNKGEIEMLTKKMLKNAAECVALKYNMNKLEQTIRDLQLYNDVGWDEINDMFNLALTALREKAERKLDDNTIEALRKHIETLQAENEQLQAQVARMREALWKAREAIKAAWSDGSANAAMGKASEALAAIDKAIGGKEDV